MTDPRLGILHVHTDWSHDGRDSLEGLATACRGRGIAFVGLTEHAEDFDAERWPRYVAACAAASGEGVRLIPGLEFRFAGHKGLHLLALGLRRWHEPATPEQFAREVAPDAALTIVAHPVLTRHSVPDAVLAAVDAIEVWNTAYNTRWLPDPRAVRLLHAARRRRPEMVGIAGLDQHDSSNDREVRVRLTAPASDPLVEVRAGRFENIGRTMRFGPTVPWSPLRLATLTAARTAFDVMERTQDHVARRLRRGPGAR